MTVVAEEQKVAERRPSSHRVAELMFRFRELGIVLALVIVVGATTIDNHLFLSATSIQNLLSGASIIALLAIGETIVIVTRNVDLSIGSVARHLRVRDRRAVRAPPARLARRSSSSSPLGIGVVCGVVNGAIVTVARVPSLVVTLGTLYIIRGIDGAWAGGNQVNSSMLPDELQQDRLRDDPGHPVPRRSSRSSRSRSRPTRCAASGRRATSTRSGRIPTAARLAGIPVGLARVSRLRRSAAASPASPGPSGCRCTARSTRSPGVGYEFQVITAVVVGGVAIFGGSGTVLGAALGALLLNTINSALVVVNVSSFWSSAIAGALLVGAIAFDRLIAVRVAPALRTRRRARG